MFSIDRSPAFYRTLIVCAFLLLLSPARIAAQAPSPFFYYFQGQKILLPLDNTALAARLMPMATAEARAFVESTNLFESFDTRDEIPTPRLALLALRPGHAPLDTIRVLNARAEVEFATPIFTFPGGTRYILTDEFIVRFRDEVELAQRESFNRLREAEFVRTRTGNERVWIMRVMNPKNVNALDLANAYVESGLVEYAEPNFVVQMPLTPATAQSPAVATGNCSLPLVPPPNDPEYSNQWSLCNYGQFNLSGALTGKDIRAYRAWDIMIGANNVYIAIIDEGVDSTHPDLSPNIISGWNVISDTANTEPAPNDYHGTEVAGIAAAVGNNGVGIAGVCWRCKIMPIKVAYENPSGSGIWLTEIAWLADGIDQAWKRGADVLSNSWTLTGGPSADVHDAIFRAYSYGRCTTLNCSTGNPGVGSAVLFASGNENNTFISYPAADPNVIAVGASNWCDQRVSPGGGCNGLQSWGSNYGLVTQTVDLVAPGLTIRTTANPYTWTNGTSMATPMVAGVVGLMYSLNQNHEPIIPDDVKHILQVSADDINLPGFDRETGYGRLNAFRALQAMYDLTIGTNDGLANVRVGQTLTFTQYFTNTGYNDVTSGVLSVTLPSGYAYLSSTPGFMSAGGGVYTRTVALNVFASGTTTVTVTVLQAAEGKWQAFNAQLAAPFGELNTADNSSTDTDFVLNEPRFLPFVVLASP